MTNINALPAISTSDLAAGRATSLAQAANATKLHTAAEQFETMLLGALLEKLETSPLGLPDGSTDGSAESLHAVALQAVAGQLARSGKFGIARFIEAHISSPGHAETGEATPLKVSKTSADISTDKVKGL